MITAKEAKDLYDASGAEVEAYLTNEIEPKVKKAAEQGKRNVFCFVGSIEAWDRLTATPLQTRIMDKLHELGYRVQFSLNGESYVPRGLADDDGNGPRHTNYGFSVHW